MIKTIASLFAVYQATMAQPPNGVWVPVAQASTTAAPIVTTAAPATTAAPVVTTQAATTTAAPVITTQAATTTAAPVVTTAAPASTTQAAPTTTATPVQTMPPLPQGQTWGHFGQICDYTKSPIKDIVCKTPGQIATPQYAGFMKCERGYDCCMCGAVTCGTEWQGCNTFSAGDFGVKGIKDISIIGRNEQLGGGAMNFIGIESGANSVVYGENIKTINAAGAMALYGAHITVVNPVADFTVECHGPNSCENLVLDVIMEGPPPGFVCNPAWAPNGIEFASLQCSGVNACTNAEINIRNEGCAAIEIQQVECTLPSSCINTKFDFVETNSPIGINNCDVQNSWQVPQGLGKCFGMQMGQGQPQPWNGGQWLPAQV